MPKNIITDVLPPSRRSIREVPLPNRRQSRLAPKTKQDNPPLPPEIENGTPRAPRSRFFLWLIVAVCLLALVFAVSSVFSGATVKATPKSQRISIEGVFTARKGVAEGLEYKLLPITQTVSETVAPDADQYVERRASGTIVIYNNFSSEPQRFIKNTRFSTPQGLLFRIDKSVVVPGKTTRGGESIPGSIEAVAFADSVGEKYNIGLSDFAIPGLKSDPQRYSKFYARSKTPMAGGYVGTIKVVSEDTAKRVKTALQEKLKNELIAQARADLPAGYLLYDDSYLIRFNPVKNENTSGGGITISEEGVFSGFIILRENLEKEIVKKFLSSTPPEPVQIRDIDKITMVLHNKETLEEGGPDKISFTLRGTAPVIWNFDTEALKKDLAGKSKGEDTIGSILKNYPLAKTEITTRPFWKKTLPRDPDRIRIKIENPL